ncbi:MAG: hypothetical protein JSU98_11680 [Gemmatimonadales bacterium]|jgi:hypothetical protein|nr:MAG: hypothetical protein JSU98_11680 [Gemmatimonadales bacterium]
MTGKTARETLGTLGVIASLVFVGLEIQQNTQAVRAAAIQESTNVARQQVLAIAADPELTRLDRICAGDSPDLTEQERSRCSLLSLSFWWGMQGLFQQWQLEVLPDETWASWRRVICINYAAPWERRFLENATQFNSEFVAMVETCDADDVG